MIGTTHTYAILEVSDRTYAELRQKLIEAGYEDRVIDRSWAKRPNDEVIDLTQIAIKREE